MVFNDLPLVAAVTVSTEQLVHNAYLRSLVILVSFFLIARLVYWIAKKYLIKVAQKTATELDDLVLKKAEIPVAALIFLFGVKIAVIPLSLVDPWAGIIQHSVSTVVILFITYIIVILLDMLVAHWAKQYSVTSMGIAGNVVNCLVYTRDDICASGDSLFAAAAEAKAQGAKYVMALITHTQGFDKPGEKSFSDKLNNSAVDELVTTNSLTRFSNRVLCESALQQKITVLDISKYLAEVILRTNSGLTIREMMSEVKPETLYSELFTSEAAKKN